MAKRFTDTNKWRKDFIRGLQGAYKLLWLYILDECDHAGIWHVELDVAELRIGFTLDENDILKSFKGHIFVFDNGHKWFVPDFIEFQYGTLNPENRAHKSVLDLLEKYKLKGHLRSLQGRKDKDKEMVKELVKEKEIFDKFRKLYPGSKRGIDTEYDNFIKKHKDWKDVIFLLIEQLQSQISIRDKKQELKQFVPEWKNLQTWINQRCWEEEIIITKDKQASVFDKYLIKE